MKVSRPVQTCRRPHVILISGCKPLISLLMKGKRVPLTMFLIKKKNLPIKGKVKNLASILIMLGMKG